jgi:hypothetical protein
MTPKEVGETIGTYIGSTFNLAVKLSIILACGRYLGWW